MATQPIRSDLDGPGGHHGKQNQAYLAAQLPPQHHERKACREAGEDDAPGDDGDPSPEHHHTHERFLGRDGWTWTGI